MSLLIESEPTPLEVDANGVVLVGGTRITLDTIVAAFSQGATAEEITHQYPSLHLADVYAVIGYYLRRREAVESYLQHRKKDADNIRKQSQLPHPEGMGHVARSPGFIGFRASVPV